MKPIMRQIEATDPALATDIGIWRYWIDDLDARRARGEHIPSEELAEFHDLWASLNRRIKNHSKITIRLATAGRR